MPKSIVDLYKQYLFGRVNADILNRGKHIYIQCRQCKDSITSVSYTHLTLPTNREV